MGLIEEYFQNKLILVSGVGTGQGLSTVRLLSRFGARVIVISRHELPGEIQSQFKDAQFMMADVSNEKNVKEMKLKLEENGTRLNGIVNNAGIWEPAAERNVDPDTLTRFLISNTMSQYNVIYHLKSLLVERSSVVNIGAAHSLYRGNGSGYTISKYAIEEMTRSFASELWKRNIRVNGILPGSVSKEDIFAKVFPFNFSNGETPLDPLSISYITAFLLSPLSYAINGQCITADRGSDI